MFAATTAPPDVAGVSTLVVVCPLTELSAVLDGVGLPCSCEEAVMETAPNTIDGCVTLGLLKGYDAAACSPAAMFEPPPVTELSTNPVDDCIALGLLEGSGCIALDMLKGNDCVALDLLKGDDCITLDWWIKEGAELLLVAGGAPDVSAPLTDDDSWLLP